RDRCASLPDAPAWQLRLAISGMDVNHDLDPEALRYAHELLQARVLRPVLHTLDILGINAEVLGELRLRQAVLSSIVRELDGEPSRGGCLVPVLAKLRIL